MGIERWRTFEDLERVLDTLIAVKKLIAAGWCQHAFELQDGSRTLHSLSGALYKVTGGDARFYRAMGQLKHEIVRRGFKSLGHLNDSPEMTQLEALRFLAAAGQDIIERMQDLPHEKPDDWEPGDPEKEEHDVA